MRTKVFKTTTPYPDTPEVTLWDNTWTGHIQTEHPEMSGKLANMQTTLSSPTFVCEASNPAYVVFVNDTDLDARGHPLVVCVSPTTDSSGLPVVTTAYHSKKHKDPKRVKKIWPKA